MTTSADVPTEQTEAPDLATSLGIAIRSARKSAALTLQDVADRTGLSQSFLSQAENGRTVPSVMNLHAIARCVGTTAHELLSQTENDASLVRAAQSPVLEVSPGATMRRCALRGGSMGPNEITAGPHTSSSSATTHPGEEFIYVVDGSLEVEVGSTTYTLGVGDVLYFSATVAHRWHNRSDAAVRFLITASPPF
ncbi:helix-turn-helix domain-containing protein [Gordonia sp. DT30]|uniref:helix-turn-helix domain-containing protein n=1 Tax=unclassified Gordonia (in: high G+C Gram-positive bacteria) TaxID=2657482 RepID=UPI003CF73C40